eukprot:scaffold41651_cov150-Skeletonema_dohrnii-CCMP3373.AAC.2
MHRIILNPYYKTHAGAGERRQNKMSPVSTIHHIMAHRTRQEMKESSTSIKLPFREVKTSSLSQIFFLKRMAILDPAEAGRCIVQNRQHVRRCIQLRLNHITAFLFSARGARALLAPDSRREFVVTPNRAEVAVRDCNQLNDGHANPKFALLISETSSFRAFSAPSTTSRGNDSLK